MANVATVNDEVRRSAGREFQTTTQETVKSPAPRTVLVLRTTSFRISADLRCRLLATDETSTQSSVTYIYAGANPFKHWYTVVA